MRNLVMAAGLSRLVMPTGENQKAPRVIGRAWGRHAFARVDAHYPVRWDSLRSGRGIASDVARTRKSLQNSPRVNMDITSGLKTPDRRALETWLPGGHVPTEDDDPPAQEDQPRDRTGSLTVVGGGTDRARRPAQDRNRKARGSRRGEARLALMPRTASSSRSKSAEGATRFHGVSGRACRGHRTDLFTLCAGIPSVVIPGSRFARPGMTAGGKFVPHRTRPLTDMANEPSK